jgi:hypothetical protein
MKKKRHHQRLCILGWVDVGTMAQEYGGDLLDFMKKKHRKLH